MNMKMVTFASALALVGCGGLHEESDIGGDNAEPTTGPTGGRSHSGTAGTGYGGSGPAEGGEGGYTTAGTGYGGHATAGTGSVGGYEMGGESAGGTGSEGGHGGVSVGGEGGFATAGEGGASVGGESGGGGTGSVPPSEWTCSQNVAHCFDAAANCYEYSPWSDCDQIVDVCSEMQGSCDASP